MWYRGIVCSTLLLGAVPTLWAQAGNKADTKQLPPALVEILQSTPEEFLKRHDKDKDGFLSKDEVPPFLGSRFEIIDKNGDGKLDVAELTQVFQNLRARQGADPKTKPANPKQDTAVLDKIVDKLMQMDTDKDGKISRQEAQGPLGANFEKLDSNKDGFLDRDEVRRFAQRFAGTQKGGRPAVGPQAAALPDFDSFDKNADGRLTREELEGTSYRTQFEQIDSNRDGRIDRREFESFLRRNLEKKE